MVFPQRGKTTPGPHSTPLEFHSRNHARAAAEGFLRELYMSFNRVVCVLSKKWGTSLGREGGKRCPL
jgi:hypothetical protein